MPALSVRHYLIVVTRFTLYLQRTDALRWTPYFGDNLRELEENPQWIGDTTLAHQVRLQLVIDRVSTMVWFDASLNVEPNTRIPPLALIQPLQNDLAQVREKLSPDLQSNSKPPLSSCTVYGW
jgi:hypothetical protein